MPADPTPPGEDSAQYLEEPKFPSDQPGDAEDAVSMVEPRAGLSGSAGQRDSDTYGNPAARAHDIAGELTRVESEVRGILEAVDDKHKRKLGGTSRWHELEDDIIAWRYSGRIAEADLARLRQLVARRHHLFRQLSFLAGTRPTWNS